MVSATHSGTRSCGRRSTPISSPASAPRSMPRSPRSSPLEPELAGAQAAVAAEIAHHWTAAGEIEAALAASVRAGAEAERMYAIQEARRQYERVLELWDRVAEPERITGLPRSALLARAADASGSPGMKRVRWRSLAARSSTRNSSMTMPARPASRSAWPVTFGARAIPMARSRLLAERWPGSDSGEPSADRARALCAEGRMLVMRSRNQEARERLEESLEIARTIGASSEEAQALNYLGGALAFLGDYPGGIERLRAAVRIARETGSRARGLSQYENLSEVLAEAGQLEHARDVASEGIAAAQEVGLQRSYGLVLMGRGALCALALGRTTEAGELTRAALELGEHTFFAFNVLEARARYELVRGEFDAAERHLAAADAMAARVGDPMWTGPVAAARAELELWRGHAQEAAEIVRAALAVGPERQCLQHTSELHAVGARALAELAVAARARHQDSAAGTEAAALLARLESTAHQRLSARRRPAPGIGRRRALPGRSPPCLRRF